MRTLDVQRCRPRAALTTLALSVAVALAGCSVFRRRPPDPPAVPPPAAEAAAVDSPAPAPSDPAPAPMPPPTLAAASAPAPEPVIDAAAEAKAQRLAAEARRRADEMARNRAAAQEMADLESAVLDARNCIEYWTGAMASEREIGRVSGYVDKNLMYIAGRSIVQCRAQLAKATAARDAKRRGAATPASAPKPRVGVVL